MRGYSFLTPFSQALASPGPVDREAEDAVEGDRSDESLVHGMREGFGQFGNGIVAQVRQAQFSERDPGGGKVEDLCPPAIGVPVDLREILFRSPGDTTLRVGPERFKTAENHRFVRTRRDAGRDPSL